MEGALLKRVADNEKETRDIDTQLVLPNLTLQTMGAMDVDSAPVKDKGKGKMTRSVLQSADTDHLPWYGLD